MFSIFVLATLAVLVRGQGAGMMSSILSAMGGGGMMGAGGMGGMGGMAGMIRHPSSFAGMSLEGLCNFYSLQARGDKGVLSDMMAQGIPMLISNPAMLMLNPQLAGGPQYQCLAKVYARMSPAEFAGAMSDLADGAGCYNFFCFDGLMPSVISNTPENAMRLNWLRIQNRMQGIGHGLVNTGSTTSLGSLINNAMGGGSPMGVNMPSPGIGMGGATGGMSGAGNGGLSGLLGLPNLSPTSMGMGGATNGMGGATNGMGGATNGMGEATSGMGGATSGMGGATNGMGGATNGMGGATNGMGGLNAGMGMGTTEMGASAGSLNSPSTGTSALPLAPLAGASAGTTSEGNLSTGVTSPVDPAPPAQTGAINAVTSSTGGNTGGETVQQLLQRLQTQYDPARLQRLLSAVLTNPALKMMF